MDIKEMIAQSLFEKEFYRKNHVTVAQYTKMVENDSALAKKAKSLLESGQVQTINCDDIVLTDTEGVYTWFEEKETDIPGLKEACFYVQFGDKWGKVYGFCRSIETGRYRMLAKYV